MLNYFVKQRQVSQFLGAFSLYCVPVIIVLTRIGLLWQHNLNGIKFDSIVLFAIILIRKLPNPIIKLLTSNICDNKGSQAWQLSVTSSLKTFGVKLYVYILYSNDTLFVKRGKITVNDGIRWDSFFLIITVTFVLM